MSQVSLFADPPTKDTLADARRSLQTTRASVSALTDRIDVAEATLAQIVRESRFTIEELQKERRALEDRVKNTMAYLSPIRRLPLELLREIFMWCFENHPCSAWVLASVCTPWRRLSQRIPVIWSKIRLLTTQHASADTIRLWLERSGDTVPLDIEIFLRIAKPRALPAYFTSKPLRTTSTTPGNSAWDLTFGSPHTPSTHTQPPTPPPPLGNVTIVMPPSPPGSHPESWGSDRPANAVSKVSMHWGHIAFFYLVEQMHRWERFVFRFDKQFTSMGALKSITGDAPLLKEFEVSSIEAGFFAEWPWLPNSSSPVPICLPNLRTLTLQHTPFKWSSPMLRNLHTLNLRALPTSHLPLDRILNILSNNPSLKSLSMHFQGVLPPVLPLNSLTLPNLTSLALGGHFLLTTLIDNLVLPCLSQLSLDIEARDPIEDVISSLLIRSHQPPLAHLAVGYTNNALPYGGFAFASGGHGGLHPTHHHHGAATGAHVHTNAAPSTFYYGPGGGMTIISWTTLLADLSDLQSLRVGGTALEPLLNALGPPDEDGLTGLNPPVVMLGGGNGGGGSNGGAGGGGSANQNQGWTWACPRLEMLGLRGCHAHNDGVNKLVGMVDARNPSGSGGGGGGLSVGGVTPAKLKRLELHDCTSLGDDIMKWLDSRISEVVCLDPIFERSSLTHPYL